MAIAGSTAERQQKMIGVIGGGQLGRMLGHAAQRLGDACLFLDPSPDACAGQTGGLIVAGYDDETALKELAARCDVVTYEFENVPAAAVRAIEEIVPVLPPSAALEATQDRVVEKKMLETCAVPVPAFAPVSSAPELGAALAVIGLPAVVKTRRLGYDGKGQALVTSTDEGHAAWKELGSGRLIVEARVEFDREMSIVAARSRAGEMVFYPLVENHHRAGILRVSIAPAPGLAEEMQRAAEDFARAVAEHLDYVGVFAIELFEQGGRLLANEIAPRVHNSAHWTIEGADTSQFENHLRALLDLPLGSTRLRAHSAMVNLIGDPPAVEGLAAVRGAHLHLYGKAPRPGRKVGHVTITAGSYERLTERLAEVGELADGVHRTG